MVEVRAILLLTVSTQREDTSVSAMTRTTVSKVSEITYVTHTQRERERERERELHVVCDCKVGMIW